ncbi:unnamed protein product [Polarella glacialis]|uniref:Uncharacterized protein n=1 Tax=Polarella glacialis TaxID=89957 RepID=A0A813LSA2_POLGL|nr:unnamed protein product [Polarella glacialis]
MDSLPSSGPLRLLVTPPALPSDFQPTGEQFSPPSAGPLRLLVTPPAVPSAHAPLRAAPPTISVRGGEAQPGAGSRRAGPFGKGTTIYVCTHGACTAQGAAALLSDLEDLAPHTQLRPARRGCLGMCGQGPNVLLQPPSSDGKACVQSGIKTFSKVMALLRQGLDSSEPQVPEEVLQRARLMSDAMRLMSFSSGAPGSALKDMVKAAGFLSQAIDLEAESLSDAGRLRKLRMLRGRANGRSVLCVESGSDRQSFVERALADFKHVMSEEPKFAAAYAEAARVLSFVRQLPEAVEMYQRSLELSGFDQASGRAPRSKLPFGLPSEEVEQVRRSLAKLQQRLAGPYTWVEAEDSGEGDGLWKVVGISGLSWDTCIYRLENRPPAVGHPWPRQAWHVRAGFDSTTREYTPVSSAEDWEEGRLELLVKSYAKGTVSKVFGTLKTDAEAHEVSQADYSPMDDQPCWVRLSEPMLTLHLPQLQEELCAADARPTVVLRRLGIVVGGTGISPALQLLREVADPKGAFGASCQAWLLYSSRTSLDVLMLDELRAVELASGGRISVKHTLTDPCEAVGGSDPWEAVPQQQHFRGRHGHFASFFDPFAPKTGPLRTGPGEEAEFRGQVDSQMLQASLPAPGPGTRVVLCGPQGLLDSVRGKLATLGFGGSDLVELGSGHKAEASEGPRSTAGALRSLAATTTTAGALTSFVATSAQGPPEVRPAGGLGSFADRVRAAQSMT